MDVEARLRQLEARAAVQDLLGAYADAVDRQDVEALGLLFADDVEWVSPGRAEASGRAAVLDYYAAWFASPYRGSRHHVSNVVVGVAADGLEATARAYFFEVVAHGDASLVGWGNYVDVCAPDPDGRWRIRHKTVELLRLARLDEGWAGPEAILTPDRGGAA